MAQQQAEMETLGVLVVVAFLALAVSVLAPAVSAGTYSETLRGWLPSLVVVSEAAHFAST